MKKIISLFLFISLISLIYSCSEKAKSTLGPIGAPVSLQISPNSETVLINQTVKFIAYGLDNNNNHIDLNPVWSVQNGIGYMDQYGDFYGTNGAAGSITATYQNLSATIPVTVTTSPVFGVWSTYPHPTWGPPFTSANNLNFEIFVGGVSLQPSVPLGDSMQITANAAGWGFGIADVNTSAALITLNMSQYTNGHMHIAMMVPGTSDNNIQINIAYGSGGTIGTYVSFSTLGLLANGSWNTYSIPLSSFGVANANFSQISYFMILHDGTASINNTYYYSNCYWTSY